MLKPLEHRVLTVKEFCEVLKINKTKFYDDVGRGLIRPVKLGRRTVIPVEEVDAYLRRQSDQSQT